MKDLTQYCKNLGLAAVFVATAVTAQAVIATSPYQGIAEDTMVINQAYTSPEVAEGGPIGDLVCLSVRNPGSDNMPTYFDANIKNVGLFDSWCVTPDLQIVYENSGGLYTALVLPPAQAAGYIMKPQNLDLVLWIINQEFVGKPSTGNGNFTMGDVQNAIWLLIDDSISVDQGPWDQARVDEIIAAALANGEDYVPKCGDRDIKVVVPVALGCVNTQSTTAIAQVIIIEIPVPCGPGTGTPGYWANHPEAWPVDSIIVGGQTFTKDQAIALMMMPVQRDKRYTMFPALVCAMLNVLIGNNSDCIDATIDAGNAWWAVHGDAPVAGRSNAWKLGEPIYMALDQYNNGLLCAPHRD